MSRYREEYGPSDNLSEDEDFYETESPSVVRARKRRRRAMVTVLVLLLALFYAFWWAFSYFKAAGGDGAAAPTTAATCRPADPAAVEPGNITINVYNATSRGGLAASVGGEYRTAGFLVGEIANDPLKRAIEAPAEIRFGPNGQANAELVANTVQQAVLVPDERADASVDVVLGNAFAALTPVPSPSGDAALPVCPPPSEAPGDAPADAPADTPADTPAESPAAS